MPQSPDVISLLWPANVPTNTRQKWHENSIADLGLEPVINWLNFDGKHSDSIKSILMALSDDQETIYYRQEILEDFLNNPNLLEQFEEILPLFSDLAFFGDMFEVQALPFQKTLSRIGELELYVQLVERLNQVMQGRTLASRGLQKLRTLVETRLQNPTFQQMQREIPRLTAKFREIKSITLGVNLDHNLKPIAATIVSINTEPFRGSSFLSKIFGDKDDTSGISQLHTVPVKTVNSLDGRVIPTTQRADPLLYPLFKDLDGLISDIMRPIEAELKSFVLVSTRFLAALEPEIAFYLGAIRLLKQVRKSGLPMCRAEIADLANRTCVIENCYNMNLALRTLRRKPDSDLSTQVIGNEVAFDDNGRIFIITGPNQGGKTTFIQAIAIAQVMFQAGLPVPGSSARISPVDAIYTHFPVEEKPNAESGRFGEEAQRLNEIFAHATRNSLLLLNESLSSTAEGESLYLARDIMRCIRLLGARAAYTTHMHELAANADELNAMTPGDSKIVSLVAVAQSEGNGSDHIKRTYKIIASPPLGRSYANELAARYGISFDKIVDTLRRRQVIVEDASTLSNTSEDIARN